MRRLIAKFQLSLGNGVAECNDDVKILIGSCKIAVCAHALAAIRQEQLKSGTSDDIVHALQNTI